jgi:hypothetical protein
MTEEVSLLRQAELYTVLRVEEINQQGLPVTGNRKLEMEVKSSAIPRSAP